MVIVAVKSLTGQTITLNMKSSDTIAELKAKVFNKGGVCAEALNFAGKQLGDTQVLSEFVPTFEVAGYAKVAQGIDDAGHNAGSGNGGYGGGDGSNDTGHNAGSGNGGYGGGDEPNDGDDSDDDGNDDKGSSPEPEDSADLDGMTVNIKFPDGLKVVPLAVERYDTVGTLKALIMDKEGIPRRQQQLVFMEQWMENGLTLSDYSVEDGSVIHLVLSIVGGVGGKKVIKTIIKSKVTDKTVVADQRIFEESFVHSVRLTTLTSIDVKAALADASLEKLKEIERYIKHDRTNTDKKIPGIASFLPMLQTMEAAQCKINTAIDTAKTLVANYFEEHCSDEDGVIKLPKVLKLVEARIAIKEEAGMAD
eukprot:TRINITY_DN2845_c0_g1_i1.p1 TRINITY_DN2845_c0_g1~~TRINITY_DN2845_c0_g1_i1.p1  ORF type:complete len:385 (+),score=92.42 TRINITY_DN2845_c0_g1_i1:66-1157(+)